MLQFSISDIWSSSEIRQAYLEVGKEEFWHNFDF